MSITSSLRLGFSLSLASNAAPSTPPPVASFTTIGTGTGYAGSTYSVADGGTGEWWINGVASGITTTSFIEAIADEGKPRYWRRADGVTSNTIEMWVPPDLANLSSLFDIRQGVTLAGSLVTQWMSQVSGMVTQATGALQPTYGATAFDGSPGVTWDGARVMNGLALGASPASRVWVGGINFGGTGSRTFMDGQNTGDLALRIVTGDNLTLVSSGVGVRATSTGTVARGTPKIIALGYQGTTASLFDDGGVSLGSPVPSGGYAGAGTIVRIGSDIPGSARFIGTLGSFMTYDTFHPISEFWKAQGWVAWTSGTQARLDASHPYRNAPPRIQ